MEDTSTSKNVSSEVKSNSNREAELTPQSTFEITIGIKSTEIDNEFVLADLLSAKSFRLNTTSSFVWSLILRNISLEEIENMFSIEYDLASDEAHEHILRLVKSLMHSGLIALS